MGLAQESRMFGSLSQSKESTLQSFYMIKIAGQFLKVGYVFQTAIH
jgi:hypothetical protein